MFNAEFYTAPALRPDESASSSLFPSASTGSMARPLPTGVLAPDLARPISVRELARSRVPAIPPPRSAAAAGPYAASMPSGRPFGSALGVPNAPAVYAATSGLQGSFTSASQPPPQLTTYGDASNLSSLALRDIDQLSNEDLYNYASHLQESAKRYSAHLSEAYAQRDGYRSEVASLKKELQQLYMEIDRLRREHTKAADARQRLAEDNTQLRCQLSEVEAQLRNEMAKMALHRGTDPSATIRACHARISVKDAELRELREELRRLSEASASQMAQLEARRRSSEEGGADPRRSSAFSAAANDTAAEMAGDGTHQHSPHHYDPMQAGEVAGRPAEAAEEAIAQAVAEATEQLRAELADSQRRIAALEAEAAAVAEAHSATVERAAMERADLARALETVKEEREELQAHEDALVAALTLRAPVSKQDYEALLISLDKKQSALAETEAALAALQEKQNATVSLEAYVEALQRDLAEARQTCVVSQEEAARLQTLVNNLQLELQLANTANQLRQQQLEVSVSNARTLEETASDQAAAVAAAMAALHESRAANQSLQQQLASLQTHRGPTATERDAAEPTAEHAAVPGRDDVRGAEGRQQQPQQQVDEEPQVSTSQAVASAGQPGPGQPSPSASGLSPAPRHAVTNTAVSDALAAEAVMPDHEQLRDAAAFEASRRCIEDLRHDLESANALRMREEADRQVQLHAQEEREAMLKGELLAAEERYRQAEAQHAAAAAAAAATQKHLEEVVQALKEELEITQGQNDQLRRWELASREQCAALLREVEEGRQRRAEEQRAAAERPSQLSTPPSTQPTTVSARSSANHAAAAEPDKRTAANMATALQQLADRLAESQQREHELEAEKARLVEEAQRLEQRVRAAEVQRVERDAHPQAAAAAVAMPVPSCNESALPASGPTAVDPSAALEAARVAAAAAISERDTAEQRAAAAADEARTARAALDTLAGDLTVSVQQVQELAATKATLEAEHAQQSAELERVQRVVAELEARAAAESRALAEKTQAAEELPATVARLRAEGETATTKCARLECELSAARAAVDALAAKEESRAGTDAETGARLETVEARAAAAVSERDAAEQRAAAAVDEARTAKAALDALAGELTVAVQQVQELAATKATLEAEHAQQSAELENVAAQLRETAAHEQALTRTETEARSRYEQEAAQHAARTAALEGEVARLREQLSVARTAVASLAEADAVSKSLLAEKSAAADAEASQRAAAESKAALVQSERQVARAAVAELADECAALREKVAALEAAQRAAAEALAAREAAHSADSAELAVMRRRAEELEGTLNSTVDRLAEQEQLVKGLNSNAAELDARRAALEAQQSAELERVQRVVAELEAHTGAEPGARPEASEARAAAAVDEARTAKAALDALAGDLTVSVQQVQELAATKVALEAEYAQQSVELERVQRVVAELEARAVAESRALAEKTQAAEELSATVARLRADGETATARCARLESELSAARAAVDALAAKEESRAGTDAETGARLETVEARAAAAVSERDAAEQRVAAAVDEARTAKAALDALAGELTVAVQQVQELAATKVALEAEHAQRSAELERVAAQLRDTAAREQEAAQHAARTAALEGEVARLREQLSVARTAVASLAEADAVSKSLLAEKSAAADAEASQRAAAESKAALVQSERQVARAAVAELADECAALREKVAALEAAQRAAAEALAAREAAHSADSAELAVMRRRAEELEGTLNCTVDRLAEQEQLVKVLNSNAAELDARRAAVEAELAVTCSALETVVTEREDLKEELSVAKLGLERTTELYNERILEDDRLQDELNTVNAAFAEQTAQVKQGMTHVAAVVAGLTKAVEAVTGAAGVTRKAAAAVADAATPGAEKSPHLEALLTAGNSDPVVSAVSTGLEPWAPALEWVAMMTHRLHSLEASKTAGDGAGEEEQPAAAVQSPSTAVVADAAAARDQLMDFVKAQGVTLSHLRHLLKSLRERDDRLAVQQSVIDALASSKVEGDERVQEVLRVLRDTQGRIAKVQQESDEVVRLRSQAVEAELVMARRDQEREAEARVRAEAQVAALEEELGKEKAAWLALQEENRTLLRETERLKHYTSRMLDPALRTRHGGAGSAAASHLSASYPEASTAGAATTATTAVSRYTTASSAIEVVEQTHVLQVSSLQADLMLSRRETRRLEEREATLRQAYVLLEQQVGELRVDAAEAMQLREEAAGLRSDIAELETRCERLQRQTAVVGEGTTQELKQLRQRLKVCEAEREEAKALLQDLRLRRINPSVEAARRDATMRESLSGITTQLEAAQAHYGGAAKSRDSLSAALSAHAVPSSPQDVLMRRVEHLEGVVQERNAQIAKLQTDLLELRVVVSSLEDQLREKTAALKQSDALVEQYADIIERMNAANTAAAAAGQRRLTGEGRLSLTPYASVPPPTPLSTQKPSDADQHTAAADRSAMLSPTPRKPNLEEEPDKTPERRSHESTKQGTAATPSAQPEPSARRRRTEATGEGGSSSAHRDAVTPSPTVAASVSLPSSRPTPRAESTTDKQKSDASRKRVR